jgi:hypothetical protein
LAINLKKKIIPLYFGNHEETDVESCDNWVIFFHIFAIKKITAFFLLKKNHSLAKKLPKKKKKTLERSRVFFFFFFFFHPNF